jgi:hypothetical protein
VTLRPNQNEVQEEEMAAVAVAGLEVEVVTGVVGWEIDPTVEESRG